MGGPIWLPDFSVESSPLDSTDSMGQQKDIILVMARQQLSTRGILCQSISLCKRCSAGQTFTESDQTLPIVTPWRDDNSWVAAIMTFCQTELRCTKNTLPLKDWSRYGVAENVIATQTTPPKHCFAS
jgi:hypothetical protein